MYVQWNFYLTMYHDEIVNNDLNNKIIVDVKLLFNYIIVCTYAHIIVTKTYNTVKSIY